MLHLSIFIALKYINKLNRIKEFGEEAAIKFDKKGKLKKHIEEKKEAEECLTSFVK